MEKFTVSEDTEIALDGKTFLLESGDEIKIMGMHEPEEDLFWNMVEVNKKIVDFYKQQGRDVNIHDAEDVYVREFGREAFEKFKADVLGQEKVNRENQINQELDGFDDSREISILQGEIFDAMGTDGDAHSDPVAANLWKRMGDMDLQELRQFRDQVVNGEITYQDLYHL